IVNVSAKDKATGKEQSIRIQASGGLSDEDIQRMIKEAEAHAAEDKKRRELVEAKNHLEALIHSTEKSVADAGDKLPASVKSEIEAAIASAREAAQGDDIDRVKSATQSLSQASLKIGEAVYGGAQPGAQAGSSASGSSSGSGEDNVVDAEFEEVKDNNNKKDSA